MQNRIDTGFTLEELRSRMSSIDSSELIWASTESDELFDTPRLARYVTNEITLTQL